MREGATVNYPTRGLQLRRITVPPSSAVALPQRSTGFASGGQLTAWVGQRACKPSGPSVLGRSHQPPSAFLSPVGTGRSTTCHQVYQTPLAVAPRDSTLFYSKQTQAERRRAIPLPA